MRFCRRHRKFLQSVQLYHALPSPASHQSLCDCPMAKWLCQLRLVLPPKPFLWYHQRAGFSRAKKFLRSLQGFLEPVCSGRATRSQWQWCNRHLAHLSVLRLRVRVDGCGCQVRSCCWDRRCRGRLSSRCTRYVCSLSWRHQGSLVKMNSKV